MEIARLNDHPDRAAELRTLEHAAWPKFLLHSDVRNWSELYSTLAQFQTVLLDGGAIIGGGLCAPCPYLPDQPLPETIDEIVFDARWPLNRPGTVCALAAIVSPSHRGQGLSRLLIRKMIEIATGHGLAGVIAPVRPTRKHEFPYEPIDEYAARQREDGQLWDPWLRVHEQLGGRFLGICPRALTVRGSRSEWEAWTGETVGDETEHAVPGGLVPVAIDHEKGLGTYVEPNVWYFHRAPAK